MIESTEKNHQQRQVDTDLAFNTTANVQQVLSITPDDGDEKKIDDRKDARILIHEERSVDADPIATHTTASGVEGVTTVNSSSSNAATSSSSAVIAAMLEATSNVTWIKPRGSSDFRWMGFLRNAKVGRNNRYLVKCEFCAMTFQDARVERLARHFFDDVHHVLQYCGKANESFLSRYADLIEESLKSTGEGGTRGPIHFDKSIIQGVQRFRERQRISITKTVQQQQQEQLQRRPLLRQEQDSNEGLSLSFTQSLVEHVSSSSAINRVTQEEVDHHERYEPLSTVETLQAIEPSSNIVTQETLSYDDSPHNSTQSWKRDRENDQEKVSNDTLDGEETMIASKKLRMDESKTFQEAQCKTIENAYLHLMKSIEIALNDDERQKLVMSEDFQQCLSLLRSCMSLSNQN